MTSTMVKSYVTSLPHTLVSELISHHHDSIAALSVRHLETYEPASSAVSV